MVKFYRQIGIESSVTFTGTRGTCMSAAVEITFSTHQVSFIACTKSKIFFFYNKGTMYYFIVICFNGYLLDGLHI